MITIQKTEDHVNIKIDNAYALANEKNIVIGLSHAQFEELSEQIALLRGEGKEEPKLCHCGGERHDCYKESCEPKEKPEASSEECVHGKVMKDCGQYHFSEKAKQLAEKTAVKASEWIHEKAWGLSDYQPSRPTPGYYEEAIIDYLDTHYPLKI